MRVFINNILIRDNLLITAYGLIDHLCVDFPTSGQFCKNQIARYNNMILQDVISKFEIIKETREEIQELFNQHD